MVSIAIKREKFQILSVIHSKLAHIEMRRVLCEVSETQKQNGLFVS